MSSIPSTRTTAQESSAAPPLVTRQRVGLVLAGLYCLSNVPSAFFPTTGDQAGPPMSILVVDTVLAVVGLVAVVVAWRSASRAALRVVAASLVVIQLTAMPGLFVDIPAGIKLAIAASLVLMLATLVLLFSGERRPAPVVD